MARLPDLTKAIESTVARALRSEVSGEIRRLERQLGRLSEDLRRLARAAAKAARRPAAPEPKPPASKGRQRHGRYIGLLRHLPKKAQSRVRGIRHKQGVEAAIRMAMRLRKA